MLPLSAKKEQQISEPTYIGRYSLSRRCALASINCQNEAIVADDAHTPM
jgi:hypothetical protein